ncbi:MAG: B12-binding domain-containing radical SAM protein [Planctomycetes bacterium]|nr:B12-binding domain-containing radical SAM protein [Planctomycetota bacterium]
MNALLVYPRFPVTYWGFQYGLRLIGKRAALPPLGLITVAALLPNHWHVRLKDLNVDTLRDEDLHWADAVLTGGFLIQTESMQEIILRARAFRCPVAVGGPAPTTSPELFNDADVVFQGEAEGRIDELLRALTGRSGNHLVLQAPADYPDMEKVPVPRFELLDLSKYASLSVQYSRGCPFRCEFCDVIEIFGRKPRVKTPEQVISEFDAIHGLGYKGTLFLVDDNFIGNKPAVKRLLPIVRDWQRKHGHPFDFYTEASVDLAADPQLLHGMTEAGFTSVFLGIETPSAEALEESNKLQNLRIDPTEAVDRITRAGLEVMGGFIVGFDSDGPDIFALQREFLTRQPIPLAMVGMLTALPGTDLWRRLKKEKRLRRISNGDQFSRPNFQPMMDERVLLSGYAGLMKWLYSPEAYYDRCEMHLDRAGSIPETRPSTFGEVGSLLCTIWHIGVLSPRRRFFWRLMIKAMLRGRGLLRLAVSHAIKGEHLILYTNEHVVPRIERALAGIRSGIGHTPLPADFECGTPQAALVSRRIAGKAHLPVAGRGEKTRPLPGLTSEVRP